MPTCHPLAGEPDPESLVTCPYNVSHRVARKRLQFHLTKCRERHPNANKKMCPYDSTHMINEQEYQFHLEVCYKKGVIDNYIYVITNESHVIELPPEPVIPPAEENWDNECTATYEPAVKLAEKPIIHTVIGGTRSERKKCRLQQRQKFRAIDDSGPTIKVEPKVENPREFPDDKPLRQPKSLPVNFPDNSGQFAGLNRSFTSPIPEANESTSKAPKPIGVLNNGRRETASNKSRHAELNRPGSSQDSEDGFIVFKPKGRGKFWD